MARKTRQTNVSIEINSEQLKAIVDDMIVAFGKELAKALSGASVSTKSGGFKSSSKVQQIGGVAMDESIIPVKIETELESSSVKLGKKEISEDKSLSDSKKKLSNLFKHKGE